VAKRKSNPEFMTGIPELLILRLLGRQEMYGYELVKAIEETTASAIVLGEGVVYPILHALEIAGALKSKRKLVSGRSRIYYSVTASGLRRLNDLSKSWMQLAQAVQAVITGSDNASHA
jgi:PadR family transcriptional regulator, regulatory protein PadR